MEEIKQQFATPASKETVEETIAALKKNGMDAVFVQTPEEAKKRVFDLIPEHAKVMNMTSRTLDETSIAHDIVESGKYESIRKQLESMDRKTESLEMQKLGAAPEYTVGSVHAVTKDGKVLVASNTGSQLPAYAYGSAHVIWVVGTQKIVENVEEGMKRIYDYILPLESVRINNVYHMTTGSYVSKLLIINREISPERIHIIFVNKVLGF
ncbi:MAG TPA: lactate utilization protein [Patescibacteria group bacterium]|nr:lactate utilization protein [Patescibacteria group bacterium]